MSWIIVKYLTTAGLVALISEVAKRSDKLGAFVAALPLVTVLTLIWLAVEKAPDEKIANHAYYTFWYVLPTLPMFLAFPWLLPRVGFSLALIAGIALIGLCFFLTAWFATLFDVQLY